MIAFIDTYRDQFGVELICEVLRAAIDGFLTSRGYRAAKTRPASVDPEIRDEQLMADLHTVHQQNYSVCVRGVQDASGHEAAGLADRPRAHPAG